MSGTVGEFLQDGLLLDLGAATLKLEIARRRYGDLGGKRGGGTRRFQLVTGTTKKTADGSTIFCLGAAIQKPGRRPKKVLTGVKLHTSQNLNFFHHTTSCCSEA